MYDLKNKILHCLKDHIAKTFVANEHHSFTFVFTFSAVVVDLQTDSLRSWRYCVIKVLAAEPRSKKGSEDEATPHNLQKSSTLSSLAFLPLTGFAGVSPLDFKHSPWKVAMRAVNHQQSETFCAKIIESFELQVSHWLADLIGISRGDKSGRHSKNHGSLADCISRGFAARVGSATKSHSTSTQYRQLRRLRDRLHLKFPFSCRNWRSRSSLFPVNRRRRRELPRGSQVP